MEGYFYRKENGKYQLNLWEAKDSVRDSSGTYRAESLYLWILYSRASQKRGNLGAFLG